jgi:glycosyltransferase involved in cell wall biosynthesis
LARNAEAVASQIGGLLGLRHRGYFMFFGAIEPKKNVDRLLQAFLAANVSEPLVLVGRKAWKSTKQLRLLELEDPRIRHVDYLPFPLLVSLIQGARGVIFPSLYEGFGLPVLEAMQCGTPVIASNASSLPEVAGNAALLVDPYNPSELSQAIRTLSGDGDLAERLAREGLRQARQFTPEAYQGRLRTLYRRLGVPV